jgi:thiol-disulfide isomerase/thioredoxin
MPNLRMIQPWLALVMVCFVAGCAMPPPNLPANRAGSSPEVDLPALPNVQVVLPTVTPTPLAAGDLAPEQAALLASLRNFGPAPELTNQTWFNSEPLTLAQLRGKVVMVEFWTYGCINCQRVIPYVQQWYQQYKAAGFEVIGVHTPEFAQERELSNVEAAIARLGVNWPVAIDNDWATWRAYGNHYWPAAYLIDKAGNIRLLKIGEGQYEYVEQVIQALLAETPS